MSGGRAAKTSGSMSVRTGGEKGPPFMSEVGGSARGRRGALGKGAYVLLVVSS